MPTRSSGLKPGGSCSRGWWCTPWCPSHEDELLTSRRLYALRRSGDICLHQETEPNVPGLSFPHTVINSLVCHSSLSSSTRTSCQMSYTWPGPNGLLYNQSNTSDVCWGTQIFVLFIGTQVHLAVPKDKLQWFNRKMEIFMSYEISYQMHTSSQAIFYILMATREFKCI